MLATSPRTASSLLFRSEHQQQKQAIDSHTHREQRTCRDWKQSTWLSPAETRFLSPLPFSDRNRLTRGERSFMKLVHSIHPSPCLSLWNVSHQMRMSLWFERTFYCLTFRCSWNVAEGTGRRKEGQKEHRECVVEEVHFENFSNEVSFSLRFSLIHTLPVIRTSWNRLSLSLTSCEVETIFGWRANRKTFSLPLLSFSSRSGGCELWCRFGDIIYSDVSCGRVSRVSHWIFERRKRSRRMEQEEREKLNYSDIKYWKL